MFETRKHLHSSQCLPRISPCPSLKNAAPGTSPTPKADPVHFTPQPPSTQSDGTLRWGEDPRKPLPLEISESRSPPKKNGPSISQKSHGSFNHLNNIHTTPGSARVELKIMKNKNDSTQKIEKQWFIAGPCVTSVCCIPGAYGKGYDLQVVPSHQTLDHCRPHLGTFHQLFQRHLKHPKIQRTS